ncbi:MAG: glycogen debranching protein GlgX [Chitinispirillaceae bacterium]|jgi:glycogen operon protein|nr:glycogen debranching protein GlgX [Chitinispirillaceae bacterium]
MSKDLHSGHSYPLGATVTSEGINFCLFSRHAAAVDLLLFDDVEESKPSRTIRLDRHRNKTANYWHLFVPGLVTGQVYGYRVHGPYDPKRGLRFDGNKVLLDPYTRAVAVSKRYDRAAAIRPGDNCAAALKSVVVDTDTYDWKGDEPLRRPYSETLIYEMHVGGFTRNPNSGVAVDKRGTYAGLIEKIPYLKSLGITAVELQPVQKFDDQDAPGGLTNYWGYSPVAFFAPHSGFSSRRDPIGPVSEFRDMVAALHKAGIEVILDVVFNHTAEGNHQGPTFSFKGIEDGAYYMLDQKGSYLNYTGCGNTINANYSIVRRLIMDCLRHWVSTMHVDGFRFDLASVLSRDEKGVPLLSPPVLWEIDSDPVLAGTKIIAEAWDAGGLYQVGSFAGDRFHEWNGRFRDDVRRFVNGENGTAASMASRVLGSPDIYPDYSRRSINFVTCHDGFTMNDLVSYNAKHNEANCQKNTDGADYNASWNCGVEGPTDRQDIETLRERQMKNYFTVLMLARGTPMLLMGDEVRRTQGGNNNAYCQDNETSWLDWSACVRHASMLRFVKSLAVFIHSRDLFRHDRFAAAPATDAGDIPVIEWHGVRLSKPDLTNESHTLAFTLRHPAKNEYVHVMQNAYWEKLDFEVPVPPEGFMWHRIIDTALISPDDIVDSHQAPGINKAYGVQARSTVVLAARKQ